MARFGRFSGTLGLRDRFSPSRPPLFNTRRIKARIDLPRLWPIRSPQVGGGKPCAERSAWGCWESLRALAEGFEGATQLCGEPRKMKLLVLPDVRHLGCKDPSLHLPTHGTHWMASRRGQVSPPHTCFAASLLPHWLSQSQG